MRWCGVSDYRLQYSVRCKSLQRYLTIAYLFSCNVQEHFSPIRTGTCKVPETATQTGPTIQRLPLAHSEYMRWCCVSVAIFSKCTFPDLSFHLQAHTQISTNVGYTQNICNCPNTCLPLCCSFAGKIHIQLQT